MRPVFLLGLFSAGSGTAPAQLLGYDFAVPGGQRRSVRKDAGPSELNLRRDRMYKVIRLTSISELFVRQHIMHNSCIPPTCSAISVRSRIARKRRTWRRVERLVPMYRESSNQAESASLRKTACGPKGGSRRRAEQSCAKEGREMGGIDHVPVPYPKGRQLPRPHPKTKCLTCDAEDANCFCAADVTLANFELFDDGGHAILC